MLTSSPGILVIPSPDEHLWTSSTSSTSSGSQVRDDTVRGSGWPDLAVVLAAGAWIGGIAREPREPLRPHNSSRPARGGRGKLKIRLSPSHGEESNGKSPYRPALTQPADHWGGR